MRLCSKIFARGSLLATIALLLLAVIPLPGHRAKSAMRSLRSPEPNRADRESHAGGYYVGLIDGGPDSGRDELTLRLLGKTSDWQSFHDVGATEYLEDDFLQFQLKPNLSTYAFGRPFTTNARGLRDRKYTIVKPPKTIRIALLGSSMDMGWGVSMEETYENRLEDWLNIHAARRGIDRKFEVINFAMAAYSPLHRLETFRRKARDYQPDLVLYSATMLDARLLDIHLRSLLRERIDPSYDFLREALSGIDVAPDDLRLDAFGEIRDKGGLKNKLKPHLADIADATIAELDAQCRARHVALAIVVIPRVGKGDAPEERAPTISRFEAITDRLAIPLLDLSPTFDDRDPSAIEIAPWDDHPNAIGHRLLFEELARELVENASLYRILFGIDPPEGPTSVPVPEGKTAHRR